MAARRIIFARPFCFFMLNCSRLGGGVWIANGTEQMRSTNKALHPFSNMRPEKNFNETSFGRLLCEKYWSKIFENERGSKHGETHLNVRQQM